MQTVLIITCNFPLNGTVGILQRMYQPYFGQTIFCGPWLPEEYDDNSGLPKMLHPYSYIYLSKKEMVSGYYAYYCLAKVKDLRLENVDGYFVNADDNVFNFWRELDLNKTMHSLGIHDKKNVTGPWWRRPVGMKAAEKAVKIFEERYYSDDQIQQTWNEYQEMVSSIFKYETIKMQRLLSFVCVTSLLLRPLLSENIRL
ncbi:hypothetical protein OESDEN_02062 [Oesophagostomum dentatum]|uniref:Uncharacterized protein n=1 Tax=Oesophagostomum dentatum TaxID=61180 RepID=A0A0B1TQ43_OESDE|nr:hypothetical protein OESDEN_02062 [Oesophagostomum dentatum]